MAASINRGINRRLEELEKRIGPPEKDEAAALQTALLHEWLDELASLKSSRAVHYRAGKRVEPEDIPGKILGSDYTWEEVRELAMRRVVERRAREGLSD